MYQPRQQQNNNKETKTTEKNDNHCDSNGIRQSKCT